MTQADIKKLRAVISEAKDYDLYNILGAIRGNDNSHQGDLKKITALIRRYIGFEYSTCSGMLGVQYSFESVAAAMDKMFNRKSEHDHYPFHLQKAVESIGNDNFEKGKNILLKFQAKLEGRLEEFKKWSEKTTGVAQQ